MATTRKKFDPVAAAEAFVGIATARLAMKPASHRLRRLLDEAETELALARECRELEETGR